jgi:succinoglycan biosynthesis protein ExoA
MSQDLVSVVVPARNEAGAIEPCLRSILEQDWSNLEVLVVDGCSTDGTQDAVEAIAKNDSRVRMLQNPDRVVPAALNVGLAACRSPWLVRVDAHALIPKDYVSLARELLGSGEFGAVGGRKEGQGETPAGRAIAAAMGSRFGVGGSTYHYGARPTDVEHVPFGAYPVALLKALGGWNESLHVNQDFELDYRIRKAGYRVRFDPRMSIRWQSRQSINQLLRQYYRYGRGKVRVAMLHPGSVRPRHLGPPLLTLILSLAVAFSRRQPKFATSVIAPYAATVAAGTVTIARKVDPEARPYVAPALVAMHLSWGAGFWRGLADMLLQRVTGGRTQS